MRVIVDRLFLDFNVILKRMDAKKINGHQLYYYYGKPHTVYLS